MRKWLCVFILVVTKAISAAQPSDEPVNIPDKALKSAIESELKISDPNRSDMLKLTSLQASGLGVSDLTGLEHAANLTGLYLKENMITDISVVYGMQQLIAADFSGNRIRKLPDISKIPITEGFFLHNNEFGDVRAIYRSGAVDGRPDIIFWEGNRDPDIDLPPVICYDKDNKEIALPETVRDKIIEVSLNRYLNTKFLMVTKPPKFSDLFGRIQRIAIDGTRLNLYLYRMQTIEINRATPELFVLIVHDPKTDRVTPKPILSYARFMNLTLPPEVYFEDINLDGNPEIAVKKGDHFGTMANTVEHIFHHIGSDLSLTPIYTLTAWQSTSYRVLSAEKRTYYCYVSYIEPVKPNHIIVHTIQTADRLKRDGHENSRVVLKSKDACSPFEQVSREVFPFPWPKKD